MFCSLFCFFQTVFYSFDKRDNILRTSLWRTRFSDGTYIHFHLSPVWLNPGQKKKPQNTLGGWIWIKKDPSSSTSVSVDIIYLRSSLYIFSSLFKTSLHIFRTQNDHAPVEKEHAYILTGSAEQVCISTWAALPVSFPLRPYPSFINYASDDHVLFRSFQG